MAACLRRWVPPFKNVDRQLYGFVDLDVLKRSFLNKIYTQIVMIMVFYPYTGIAREYGATMIIEKE